jgi:thioredoxin 1
MRGRVATFADMHEITEESFEAEVLRSPVPVLLDFTASWCGPCRALTPILERIARENEGRLKVATVDGDAHPGIATRLGVRGFPTIIAFREGKEVARHIGVTNKERLLALVAT